MSNTDNKIISQFTDLIRDLLEAAQEHPTVARKYTRARGFVERGLKQLGTGYRRELLRPKSIGLPVQELKLEKELPQREVETDFAADNLPEVEDKPIAVRRKKQ